MQHKRSAATAHVFLGRANHSERDLRADISNAGQTGVHKLGGDLVRGQRAGQGDGGLLDHGVRDVPRLREDATHADAGEDVHVVALAGLVHLALELDGLVGTARREQYGAICPGGCI